MHYVYPAELCTQRYLHTAKGNLNEWSKWDYHNRLRNITREDTKLIPEMTWASFRIHNNFWERHSQNSDDLSFSVKQAVYIVACLATEDAVRIINWFY
jgi:hypothetical protein